MLASCWLLFVGMLTVDLTVSYLARDKIYSDVNTLPAREYAVVLGTAKYYSAGVPNLYYKNRLEAAEAVLSAHKAKYLLLSGDNQTPYYNEPKMMTEDLHKAGIASEKLKQDYAGYNTFDSVIRADRVFHLKPFTLISQPFHCERALFIAQYHNIDAICFTAKHPESHYRVRFREFFARTAMVLKLLAGQEATTLAPSKIVENVKK
ncbi:hypothetical protein A4G19_14625 [Pasteurellaceae bacterium Macca]|nr:hypothetical protein [Pasteurellaceae bacterium Macca]